MLFPSVFALSEGTTLNAPYGALSVEMAKEQVPNHCISILCTYNGVLRMSLT